MGDLDLTKSDVAPPSQSSEEHVMELAKKEEAQILARVMVAQRVPRDVVVATTKMKELAGRPDMAKQALYSFQRGGTPIEDLSVNMARPMAALWGNISFGFQVLLDDGSRVKIRCYAWDMQTNASIDMEDSFANLIQRRGRGWITPDERDKRELVNRHAAIGIRNCILQLIPKDISIAVKQVVMETLSGNIGKDLNKSREGALTEFGKLGIKPQQLAVLLTQWRDGEATTIQDATADELRRLFGIHNSIRDGNSKWTEYIRQPRETKVSDGDSNGVAEAGAKAGDAADHQSVKTDESGAAEKDTVATDKQRMINELLSMSANEKYNKVPGLKARFEILGSTAVDMSELQLEKEITNIEDVRLKHEKAAKNTAKKDKQGKLM